MIEARAIAGVDPKALLTPVAAAMGAGVTTEWISSYPARALDAGRPLVEVLVEISGKAPQSAVSFGTEVGLFQVAGIASIICGPGDIARAHRPEEYLLEDELNAAAQMILALGRHLAR